MNKLSINYTIFFISNLEFWLQKKNRVIDKWLQYKQMKIIFLEKVKKKRHKVYFLLWCAILCDNNILIVLQVFFFISTLSFKFNKKLYYSTSIIIQLTTHNCLNQFLTNLLPKQTFQFYQTANRV